VTRHETEGNIIEELGVPVPMHLEELLELLEDILEEVTCHQLPFH